MTDMYLKVTLNSDPNTVAWVGTTEANQATKRRSIRRDIAYQRFPRWAPFAHPAEYTITPYHLDKTTEYMLCYGSVDGYMVKE